MAWNKLMSIRSTSKCLAYIIYIIFSFNYQSIFHIFVDSDILLYKLKEFKRNLMDFLYIPKIIINL